MLKLEKWLRRELHLSCLLPPALWLYFTRLIGLAQLPVCITSTLFCKARIVRNYVVQSFIFFFLCSTVYETAIEVTSLSNACITVLCEIQVPAFWPRIPFSSDRQIDTSSVDSMFLSVNTDDTNKEICNTVNNCLYYSSHSWQFISTYICGLVPLIYIHYFCVFWLLAVIAELTDH